MPDTLTPTAPAAPASPAGSPAPTDNAPASASPYADAHAKLQGASSWADVFSAPTASTSSADAPTDAATIDAAAPASPVDGADAAPEGEGEAPAADAMAGFQLDAEGRLHRPDGTYATNEEVAQWNEGAAPAPETTAEPAAEPNVVAIRGRDGNEVEIEVDDPKVAEVLQTLQRDSMRKQEFTKRMEAVQQREAEFREFETLMATNPESVILQHLPADKQVSIAVALLAQHWDALAPVLVQFDTNDQTRLVEAANARLRMTQQQAEFEQRRQVATYAAQAETTVRNLIPEHIADDVAEAFLNDASADLARAIQQRNGQPIPLDQITAVLARRVSLYGFDQPQSGAPATVPIAPAQPKRPVAKPVAASQPSAPTASVPASANAGATVRRAVTAQRVAAAVPPAGAGAATVRQPLVPPNATVKDASAALKRARSWSEVGR